GPGVAGGEVQRAGGRGPERRAERAVAHGEVLRVVPQRGGRVAVVVVHDVTRDARLARRAAGAAVRPCELREAVHLAAVERLLLGQVVVVLVARQQVVDVRGVVAARVHTVRVR